LPQPAAGAGRARQILAFALACLVVAGVAAARSVSDASAQQELAGSWTPLASTGLSRQEVSFTEAGGRLYLFGGTETERQQVYTPTTNSWADTKAPPNVAGALDHVQGVAVGGRIYYIGGLTRWPGPDVGTVHVYDTTTNTWSRGADMGDRRRGAGGVAVHEGRIYYAGGIHDGRAVAWLDVYDPAANAWRTLPDMPTPRDHFAAAVLDGKLWAIGGRNGPGAIQAPIGVNEAFDLSTQTWSSGHAPLPMPRGGFAAAAFGCEIIVIGGEGGGSFEGAFKAVHAYHPATNTWRQLEDLEPQRHGIQAAVLGGDLYVAAGGTKQGGGGATDRLQRLTVGPQPGCPAPVPAPGAGSSSTPPSTPGGTSSSPGAATCCGSSAPAPSPVAPGPPAPGPEVVAPVADRQAPTVRALRLSRTRFHATPSGRRYGTTLGLTLSEPARLVLTVQRRSGRRLVRVRGTVATRRAAGRVTVRFSGRVGSRRLSPGRHVLTLVAIDAAGNRSKAVRRSFSILHRRSAR